MADNTLYVPTESEVVRVELLVTELRAMLADILVLSDKLGTRGAVAEAGGEDTAWNEWGHMEISSLEQSLKVRSAPCTLRVTHEALGVTQRALSVTQRALSVTQRALSVTQRALSVTQRALGVTHEALGFTQRALRVTQRALRVTYEGASGALSHQDTREERAETSVCVSHQTVLNA
jgi:hypothetical protein